ncbi:hypothetical protein FF38_01527 [Lucilia cuprina]|uniref:Uncharacterized protein n=1 Tax=Lucilia cuprina TaxID=7375 RepID=A0A0L0CD53_LUCCU|nr:hypothetical protein FF38_01527 [Lucilia cuprina]
MFEYIHTNIVQLSFLPVRQQFSDNQINTKLPHCHITCRIHDDSLDTAYKLSTPKQQSTLMVSVKSMHYNQCPTIKPTTTATNMTMHQSKPQLEHRHIIKSRNIIVVVVFIAAVNTISIIVVVIIGGISRSGGRTGCPHTSLENTSTYITCSSEQVITVADPCPHTLKTFDLTYTNIVNMFCLAARMACHQQIQQSDKTHQ